MDISIADVLQFLWRVVLKGLDFVAILIAASAAAVFGAWMAFRLQAQHERALARRSYCDIGRRAQFALYTQWEILLTISDYLEEQKGYLDGREWYRVQPMLDFEEPSFIEAGSLAFLLGRAAQVPARVHLAQNKYRHALGLLETHREYAVRFHEEVDLIPGPIRTPEELVAGVSPDTARKTAKLTYDLYDAVAEAIGTNEDVYEELLSALKGSFRGETFIGRKRKRDMESTQEVRKTTESADQAGGSTGAR